MTEDSALSDKFETINGDGYKIVDEVGSDDEEKEVAGEAENALKNGPEQTVNLEKQTVANKRSRHHRFPTKEHPVPCDVCAKLFTRADALKAHMATHTGEKPYTCPVCRKSYMKARYLREHKRSHTGAKPFSCEQCNKAFARSHELTLHRREHAGERPYKCIACGKCYLKSKYLRDHKKYCQHRKSTVDEVAVKVEEDEVIIVADLRNDNMKLQKT